MKKYLLLGGLCLTSLIATGCGNSQEAVLTNLANQIDLLNNTVSSVTKDVELPSLSSLTKDQAKSYSGVYQNTKDLINNQNNYKTAIITKNGLIKNKIGEGKISLSRENSKALTDLTSALSKNTRSLNETKAEFKKSLTDVKKTVENTSSTGSQVNAKLNRLSNCMDSQDCYYKNLLNTLSNIEKLLGIDDNSFDFSKINNTNSTQTNNTIQNENSVNENSVNVDEIKNEGQTNTTVESAPEKDNSKELQELLYQYLLNNLMNQNNCNGNCNNQNSESNYCPNCNNNSNQTPNSTYPYNANPPLNNYQYPYYNMNGYNTYGRSPLINPSRNTDTYRNISNIDTYRMNRNDYNRFNNYNYYYQPTAPVINNEIDEASEKVEKETETLKDKTNDTSKEVTENVSIPRKKEEVLNESQNQKFIGPVEKMKTIEINTSILDKVKGHTQKLNITFDTNKKIEDLLRKDVKDTFNSNNFIVLR